MLLNSVLSPPPILFSIVIILIIKNVIIIIDILLKFCDFSGFCVLKEIYYKKWCHSNT